MSNFKVGDLALIVGSNCSEGPNIGRVVELIEYLMPGQEFSGPDGASYENGADTACWLVFGDGLLARNLNDQWVAAGGMALAEERHLLPLRGDFQPEQEKAKEVEA
ncbi:hypothetical protein [Pseudomonas sp. zfem003]|uniref:hypothetical protein n=1 Tax=Pseudomonas sp. zfem003 TaxID=3078198 RepID=UPI002929074F|nr:hypothetical protein [Pseudomonas sp. zfem003]MDU9398056.1 hypothetical protein [Pseudomonas sp. zfem003]